MEVGNKKNRKKSNRLLLSVKIIITVSLCSYILLHADWENIRIAIFKAKVWLIFMVLLGMLINIVVSALKWKMLLAIHGIHCQLGKLTRYYLTATFFSNFLPGTIGGDGYRIYKVFKDSNSKEGAIVSVFTERLVGIIVLLFLGFFGAIASFIQFGDELSLNGVLFGGVGILIFSIILFFLSHKKIQTWIQTKLNLSQSVGNFFLYFNDYRGHPREFIKFVAVSILFYILMFLCRLILIFSFGESCAIYSLVMVVMVSTVLAALPISLNGIGILDGSFIYLISKYGVTYDVALMVMVLYRMLYMVNSLIGGIFYYMDRGKKIPEAYLREDFYTARKSVL